ncbi:MAG: hypothetical protein GY811_20595 [Myxococcales bacterium]|nr:hypothetical protein [Myxococcales bacterium]
MARPYRPTRRPTIRATAALLCAGVGVALLLSVGWPLLGGLGDILIIGTVARALLIGLLLSAVLARTAFAHSWAAATIAIFATAMAILGAHHQRHLENRSEGLVQAEDQRLRSLGFGRDALEIDQEYRENVERLSFGNYVREYFGFASASNGESGDGAASKVGPGLGVGLYIVELLIALLASTYFPVGRASEPACSDCGRWLIENEPRRVAHGVSSEFIGAIRGGASEDAFALLKAPDTREYVELCVASCPARCNGAASVLRIRDFTIPRGSGELVMRHRADLVLSGSEAFALESNS